MKEKEEENPCWFWAVEVAFHLSTWMVGWIFMVVVEWEDEGKNPHSGREKEKKEKHQQTRIFPFSSSPHTISNLNSRLDPILTCCWGWKLCWVDFVAFSCTLNEIKRRKKKSKLSSRELSSYFSLNFHFSTSQQRWNFSPNVHRNFRGFPPPPQKPSNEVERNLADGIYYGWSKSKTLFKMNAREFGLRVKSTVRN